jgi:uncharacterized Zn finger protein (UPF0148 family)
MKTCEDCGTPLSNGLCPNCQEEAVIFERFSDDKENKYSEAFMGKVIEQEEKRKIKISKIRGLEK